MKPAATLPFGLSTVDATDTSQWSESWPISFRLANWWATWMPRGKGAVARKIGKYWLREKKVVIRTLSGAKLAVDSSNLDTFTYVLRQGGIMAKNVVEAICRLLRDEMVFYDIGANAGVISLEVAKRFEDRVHVYSFEPQLSLARTTAISARLNGFQNLHVFTVLLGAKVGSAELFIPESSAPASHASIISRSTKSKSIRCQMETLDNLVQKELIPPPNVIKIDVEGAEFDVLRGSRSLLRRHQPCLIFESDINAERFGYSRSEICEFLRHEANYSFYFPTVNGGLEPAADRLQDVTEADIVAVPSILNEAVRAKAS